MNQSGIANINGTSIYYEVKGKGETIILVHGLPLDSRMWDKQFNALSKKYKVVRFDLAGYGNSAPHDNDFSILDDIYQLLLFLNITQATFVGLSVGGNLSIEFALKYPDMVSKLIVASTSMSGWTDISKERQEFNSRINSYYQKGNLEEIVQEMINGWLIGPYRPLEQVDIKTREKFAEMIRNSLVKERGKGKLILPDVNAIDHIAGLKIPVLIIQSEFDFPEFKSIVKFISERIEHSQVAFIPNTAHMVNMEAPDQFNQQIIDWVK